MRPAGIPLIHGLRRPRGIRSRGRHGCFAAFASLSPRSNHSYLFTRTSNIQGVRRSREFEPQRGELRQPGPTAANGPGMRAQSVRHRLRSGVLSIRDRSSMMRLPVYSQREGARRADERNRIPIMCTNCRPGFILAFFDICFEPQRGDEDHAATRSRCEESMPRPALNSFVLLPVRTAPGRHASGPPSV